jgi:hypothetical protein
VIRGLDVFGVDRALPATRGAWRAGWRAVVIVLWLAGAVVTWNTVFDAHIVRGARDYVDRQQLFIEGRGPRQDMQQAMAAARSAGLSAAWMWTGLELVPGAALWLFVRSRRRPRVPPTAR